MGAGPRRHWEKSHVLCPAAPRRRQLCTSAGDSRLTEPPISKGSNFNKARLGLVQVNFMWVVERAKPPAREVRAASEGHRIVKSVPMSLYSLVQINSKMELCEAELDRRVS